MSLKGERHLLYFSAGLLVLLVSVEGNLKINKIKFYFLSFLGRKAYLAFHYAMARRVDSWINHHPVAKKKLHLMSKKKINSHSIIKKKKAIKLY